MNSEFKVGNVAIVGRPNVGKSTLINALINQKVAAVSSRPQTTQRIIQAFHEDERGQIFIVDTPGLFEGKNREQMEKLIKEALSEADLILYVIDRTRDWGREEDVIFDLINKIQVPILLIVNKIDVLNPNYEYKYIEKINSQNPIRISALKQSNVNELINKIYEILPIGERISSVDGFPTPILSQNSKEYLSEIIREKIYQFTDEEVPYQCRVEVISVKSNLKDLIIDAIIKVAKDRYKGILIGKKATMIKKIGVAVRRELEIGTNKHVRVNLQVKV